MEQKRFEIDFPFTDYHNLRIITLIGKNELKI